MLERCVIGACIFFAAGFVGCGDDTGTGGAGATGSSQSVTSASSAKSSSGSGPGSTTSTQASTSSGGGGAGKVRVVHISPDAPAVDFCVTPNGGNPIGPVLKSLGVTAGIAYPHATPYVDLPAGTYSARIVAPNAADCSTALASLPDVPGIVVAADGAYTVAATGLLTPTAPQQAFEVKLYEDDLTVTTGKDNLRFIHASPGTPNVDVGLGSGDNFTAVWTDVAYGTVGQVSGKDYVSIDPPSGATLSARAHGANTDALVLDGVTLPTDQVVTVFAVGVLGNETHPLKALACLDLSADATCLLLP